MAIPGKISDAYGVFQSIFNDFSLGLTLLLFTKIFRNRCKRELYRNLSLDIDPSDEEHPSGNIKRSVQRSLDRFFSTEVREIKCEKCGDGQFAEQTMRILSAPKTLILHLKRFAVVEVPRTATDQVDENQPNGNHQNGVEFCIRKKKVRTIHPSSDFVNVVVLPPPNSSLCPVITSH